MLLTPNYLILLYENVQLKVIKLSLNTCVVADFDTVC